MEDDIEKLDEQIQSILDTEKPKIEEDVLEENDSLENGDTIKIENLDEVEKVETVPTEAHTTVLESKEFEQEPILEEKTEAKQEMISEEQMEVQQDREPEKQPVVEDSTPSPIPQNRNKKESSNKKILIIALLAVIIVLLVICIILLIPKKSSNQNEQGNKTQDLENILKNYGDAVKGVVAVYKEKNNIVLKYEEAIQFVHFDYDVVCGIHELYDDGNLYLNDCSIDDKDVDFSYGEKQEKEEVIIPEGAIKVYVSKSDGVATLKEPKDTSSYTIYAVDIHEAYSNLILLNPKGCDYLYYSTTDHYETIGHIVNYTNGEDAIKDVSYDSVKPIKIDDYFDPRYVAINVGKDYRGYDSSIYRGENWGIYDIVSKQMTVNPQYHAFPQTLQIGTWGEEFYVQAFQKKIMAIQLDDANDASFGVLDYSKKKYTVPMECKTMRNSGDYLWCVNASEVETIYDFNGEKYLENKYDKLYGIINGKNVLVQDGNNVKLVDLKGKTIYDYGKYSFNKANFFLDYGNDGGIFQFMNQEHSGMDNEEEACLEFIYYGDLKKGEVKSVYCGGIAKPILYLYPEEETEVTVRFEHPEFLQTTYPKFLKEWRVVANKNGDLHDEDGKYYYGLYWDEVKVHSVDFQEGFYVESRDAISFLEEKLDYIGFNAKERNEFIMYWLPILEKNGKSLVYFELTEERESVNKIFIEPKPDSLLRVVIHVKKVAKKTTIKEEKLTRFHRHGFAAVEWGGTTY